MPAERLATQLTELARAALNAPAPVPLKAKVSEPLAPYGIRPFPKRGGVVTNEMIDKLREDDAY